MERVQPNSSKHNQESIYQVVGSSILRKPWIDTTNYYYYTEVRKEKTK